MPDFNALSQQFAGKPLEQAKTTLARLNISEDQVDELVIATGSDAIYGIVSGTFNRALAANFAQKHHLLPLPVEDNQIYCPGTCVTFIEDNIAAFGNLTELKTILETRLGIYTQLSANQALITLMNNTPIHAVAQISLPDLSLFHVDWSALSSTINMFGYSIELDTKAHVTANLQCTSSTTAFLLKQTLSALATARIFDNMQVFSIGTNIDLKLDTSLPEPPLTNH